MGVNDGFEPVAGDSDRQADLTRASAMIDSVLGQLVAAANPRDMNYRGDPVAYRRDRVRLGALLRRLGIGQPFPFDGLEAGVAAAKAHASGRGSWAAREAYFKEMAEGARRALDSARESADDASQLASQRVSPAIREFTDKTGVTWQFDPSDKIEEGGSGAVYRGIGPDGAAIAVKRVELGSGGEIAQKIHGREIEIGDLVAGGSSSDHLVVNLGVALDQNDLYIAMPLADESLKKFLYRKGPQIPPSEVVTVIREVAAGLQELAEVGVVHRDLKPGNILRVGGSWKLADFGIARDLAQATSQYTRKPEGTAEYMAPERITKGATTARSDLYALGVLAFEMLSGKVPFGGNDSAEIHRQHLHDQPPALPAGIPEMLQRLVYRLLAKEPADRHADARAVVDALDALDAPMAPWQAALASAALAKQRKKEGEREIAAHAEQDLQKLIERRQSALADLDDLMRQTATQVAGALGMDTVQLKQHTDSDGGVVWILSWEEYALVATAEASPEADLHLHDQAYPLLVGSLAGAVHDPRLPERAVAAQRLAANLVYFQGPEGGQWVQRIWRTPFLQVKGGLDVDAKLWELFPQIRDAQILREGYADAELSPEMLVAPFIELIEDANN